MRIARKTFSYSKGQENQWRAEKPEDQPVRPQEQTFQIPGLLKSTPTTQAGWRPLNFEETLEAVQEFANCLGEKLLVSISEHTKSHYQLGDDCTTVWVIWYWCH